MMVGRVPNGILPVGLVVFMHQQLGSYTQAGVVTAGYTVGIALSAPARGRALDHFGLTPVLMVLATLQTLVLGALLSFAWLGLGLPVLLVLAAATGATNSTSGAAMRSLWRPVLGGDRMLPTAYVVQATLEDILQVVGPLLGGVLLAIANAGLALAVAALLNLLGVFVFATSPSCRAAVARRDSGSRDRARSSSRTPGLLTLTLSTAFAGVAMGVLQVALPAFAQAHGSAFGAGAFLAVVACGSVVSGFVYGCRNWPGSAVTRYLVITAVFALLFAPLAFVGSPSVMAVLLFCTGFGYSPRTASAYLLLNDVVSAENGAEAYSWIISGVAGGSAGGSAVTGVITEHAGLPWAFATAFFAAAAGCAVALGRAKTLSAVPVAS